MHIFLDDERNPSDVTWLQLPKADWTIVRNWTDFVRLVEKTIEGGTTIDFVSFDHDLADEHYVAMMEEHKHNDGRFVDYGVEKTGYDCAKFLGQLCVEKNVALPAFTVHSLNRIGGKRITDWMELVQQHLENDMS